MASDSLGIVLQMNMACDKLYTYYSIRPFSFQGVLLLAAYKLYCNTVLKLYPFTEIKSNTKTSKSILPNNPSLSLSVCLSVCLSLSLSVCLSVCLSVSLSLSLCLSLSRSVCLSLRPSVRPSIHPSIHQSIDPSVCLPVQPPHLHRDIHAHTRVVKTGQCLGWNATNTVLPTGLSSIFKDSSLQVRSPHREYNTGSSTTVYLTILQDRLHHCELFSV